MSKLNTNDTEGETRTGCFSDEKPVKIVNVESDNSKGKTKCI